MFLTIDYETIGFFEDQHNKIPDGTLPMYRVVELHLACSFHLCVD